MHPGTNIIYTIKKLDRRHRGAGSFQYMVSPYKHWRGGRAKYLSDYYELINYMTDTWGASAELEHWLFMFSYYLDHDPQAPNTELNFNNVANCHWCYDSGHRHENDFRVLLRSEQVLGVFLLKYTGQVEFI